MIQTLTKYQVESPLPDIFWLHTNSQEPITFTKLIAEWSGLHQQTISRFYPDAAPNRQTYSINKADFRLLNINSQRSRKSNHMTIIGLTLSEFKALCPYIASRCQDAKIISDGLILRTRKGNINPDPSYIKVS